MQILGSHAKSEQFKGERINIIFLHSHELNVFLWAKSLPQSSLGHSRRPTSVLNVFYPSILFYKLYQLQCTLEEHKFETRVST